MCLGGNNQAVDQFTTKVMRSWKRRNKLKEKLLGTAKAIEIYDYNLKEKFPTVELIVDRSRIKDTLNKCALGLYFHEFSESFYGQVDTYPLFCPIPDKNYIQEQSKLENYAQEFFRYVPKKGDNSIIFTYCFKYDENNKLIVLEMIFYEGCKAIAFFK